MDEVFMRFSLVKLDIKSYGEDHGEDGLRGVKRPDHTENSVNPFTRNFTIWYSHGSDYH